MRSFVAPTVLLLSLYAVALGTVPEEAIPTTSAASSSSSSSSSSSPEETSRKLYQVRPARTKIAEPARASSLLSKIWGAFAAPWHGAAIATLRLRPRATNLLERTSASKTMAATQAGNFEDPSYCADGLAVKIIRGDNLKNQDYFWWGKSDPVVQLIACAVSLDAQGGCASIIKSKNGKERPQSKFQKDKIDPEWNQYFCFPETPTQIVQELSAHIFDKDEHDVALIVSSDDSLGRVVVSRSEMGTATERGGKPFDVKPVKTGGFFKTLFSRDKPDDKLYLRFRLPSAAAEANTKKLANAVMSAAAFNGNLNSQAAKKARAEKTLAKLSAVIAATGAFADAGKQAAAQANLAKLSGIVSAADAFSDAGKRAEAKATFAKLAAGVSAAGVFADVAAQAAAEREVAKLAATIAQDTAAEAAATKKARAEKTLAKLSAVIAATGAFADAGKQAAAQANLAKLSGIVSAADAFGDAGKRAEAKATFAKLAAGVSAAGVFADVAAQAAAEREVAKLADVIKGKPFHWACKKRVRKDYRDLTPDEKQLYWKAAQTAKDTPAGGKSDASPGNNLYDTFVMIHAWRTNKPQAHSTSAFLPWHRKFLIEFESMLRGLGGEFACLTIPYWDWSQNAEMCAQDPTCVTWHHNDPVLRDSGGPGRKDGKTHGRGTSGSAFGGRNQPGGGVGCMSDQSPFKNWVDHNGKCLSRGYDWDFGTNKQDRKGPLVSYRQLMDIMHKRKAYGTSNGFRVGLEGFPHNTQHNMLGGHMRSLESPADPIFFMHHCMVDRIWAMWQDCHDHDAAGKDGSKRAEYEEYGTQRGYFETGIDGKLLYNHPTHKGQNSEIIPTWDDAHATPRDYHSSTTSMTGHVAHDDRSVIYAEDEMQKIMRELDRKICNFDTHQNALLEMGQADIMERVHAGTEDGVLIEQACADIKQDVEAAASIEEGIRLTVVKQCEKENQKAFGGNQPPLHIRFMKRWFSPAGDATAFEDIKRDAPELLLPRCALFEGASLAEKQVEMRQAIDAALTAEDEDKHDDEKFAHEEKKNDDDMEKMTGGAIVADIEV